MIALDISRFARKVAISVSGAAVIAALLATPAAQALDDGKEVLAGGSSAVAATTAFTSPGLANTFGKDFPGPGLGGQAARILMPAGVLSGLAVNVTTENVPSSGTLRITVFVNGAPTVLTCAVAGTGTCKTGKNKTVRLSNNDALAVRAANNFVDSGSIAYTYRMLFD